jgi:D-alanyl-lipoteichoic acid acyltransferase DltB (MBOAT superfamily)
MAIGVSTWFGLPARENFRHPYFSQSVIEFWTRWHISLSSWFRHYLFYPLGRYLLRRMGSRYLFAMEAISYFVTMLVTGLWHGVTWTFVIWGGLFGIYLLIDRAFPPGKPGFPEISRSRKFFNQIANILVTDLAVCAAWMIFRANSVEEALLFFQRLFQPIVLPHFGWWVALLTPIGLVLIIDFLQIYITPVERYWTLRLRWRVAIAAGLFLLLIVFGGQALVPFVYLQF